MSEREKETLTRPGEKDVMNRLITSVSCSKAEKKEQVALTQRNWSIFPRNWRVWSQTLDPSRLRALGNKTKTQNGNVGL